MLAEKLAGSGVADKLYVDDVFSTYLYTGNGTTQTINNGIDLAGKGGLVWIKSRNDTAGYPDDHLLNDTARGARRALLTNTTDPQGTFDGVSSFNATGFSVDAGGIRCNRADGFYASWTFRKAPKFFDVVIYTGDGASNKEVAHSLGITPGMVIIKAVNQSSDWAVWHRGNQGTVPGVTEFALNSAKAGVTGSNYVTATTFYAGQIRASSIGDTNASGVTYVAYLFAHDPSADGIIQCGSFTTDSSGNATVNLGWEPQYVMAKMVSGTSDWVVIDSMRGLNMGNGGVLTPNTSSAESAGAFIEPTATGFKFKIWASSTVVFLAIRRPNKPPTTGTEVYNAIARTGTGAFQEIDCGINFDSCLNTGRTSLQPMMFDRLRGVSTVSSYSLTISATASEQTLTVNPPVLASDKQNYLKFLYASGGTYISYLFRRAPGFFDVVCYTGTGSSQQLPHNLGVVPELGIFKIRNNTGSWWVRAGLIEKDKLSKLDTAAGFAPLTMDADTATTFNTAPWNTSNSTIVTYLFATLPGVSKVGSYTGNGTSQTINAGFTTGARFVLIKRTDSTGDWYIWDTARGIVAANDPHLSLNTNAAEVTTDDSVDPDTSGFVVNQVAATNINVTGASYIFLAIA